MINSIFFVFFYIYNTTNVQMQIYVFIIMFFDELFVSTHHVVEMYIYNLEFIMSKFDLNLNYYCIIAYLKSKSINLTISKIMPKTLHRLFVCVYTNKYNILCRFYVILFGHFYIKKYNSVPLYFISCFNFDILLNFDAIK